MSGRRPGSSAAFVPPGPSRPAVKVLWALVPVLSCSLLAFVPALYLAARRNRARDWWGVAFFSGTTVAFIVGLVFSAPPGEAYRVGDFVGMIALLVGLVAAPVHFLFMDQFRIWQSLTGLYGAPVVQPGYAVPSGYPAQPGYSAQPGYGYPPVQPPYAAQQYVPAPQPPFQAQPQFRSQPGQTAPMPAPTPVPDDAARAELRELGELLRRQASDGAMETHDPEAWREGRR